MLACLLRGNDIDALVEAVAPSQLERRRAWQVHAGQRWSARPRKCIRGGLQPKHRWNTPGWIYAVYAFVIYARAAAERRGTTVEHLARELAGRHGLGEDIEGHAGGDRPVGR